MSREPYTLTPAEMVAKLRAKHEAQEARRENARMVSRQTLIERLPAHLHEYARIVGKWVWVDACGQLSRSDCDTLRELGFSFNARRRAFQHCCGNKSIFNPRHDPRDKYGEQMLPSVRHTDFDLGNQWSD